MSQVKKLALFHVWGDQRSGLTKIPPLMCTSAMGASILCFHLLSFLWAHLGSGCSLVAAGWWVFFVSSLGSLRAPPWRWLQWLMTVTSLLTHMAGNILFLSATILLFFLCLKYFKGTEKWKKNSSLM